MFWQSVSLWERGTFERILFILLMFTHGQDEEDCEGEFQCMEHEHHCAPNVLQSQDVGLVDEEVADTDG